MDGLCCRGAAALALPTLACETVLLTLSASEDRELQKARVDDSQRTRYSSAQESGGTGFSVAMTLQSQLLVLSTCRSKLEALVTDINQLRATEPNLHAVVFTQSSKAHTEICQRLVRAGYVVYELSGATDVKKRHEAIRLFQQAERKVRLARWNPLSQRALQCNTRRAIFLVAVLLSCCCCWFLVNFDQFRLKDRLENGWLTGVFVVCAAAAQGIRADDEGRQLRHHAVGGNARLSLGAVH